jgi:site-specific recombinase XerD
MSELAFLRAQLQGMSGEKAADRYLGLEEKVDPRSLRAFARRLMLRMVRVARQMPESREALAALQELDAELPEEAPELLPAQPLAAASAPAAPASRQDTQAMPELPTLEAFAEERGAEDFGEAELRDMYIDEFGVDPYAVSAPAAAIAAKAEAPAPVPAAPLPSLADRGAALQRKLDALAWLVPRMARAPLADSLVGEWFATPIAQSLRAQQVQRLDEMVRWINRTGRRWYELVPGLGKTRAHRVVGWLWAHELYLLGRLDARIVEGIEPLPAIPLPGDWRQQTATDVTFKPVAAAPGSAATTLGDPAPYPAGQDPLLKRVGIVPMEYFAWPEELDGSGSRFRMPGPNRLDAMNDTQALRAWFETYVARKSPQTLRSYRVALERLVLWAITERRRALSDLQPQDLLEFEGFLRAPPAHWVQPFPTKRASRDWRPLRGPLDPVTVRQVLAAVQSMFKRWRETGYISSDPAVGVAVPYAGRPQVDVMRCFAQQDIEAIGRTFAELEDGAGKNRLRAVITLLQSTGLRASEAVAGNWGDITPMRLDGGISDQYQIRVRGKGGKERMIPLRKDALTALQRHYEDRRDLELGGSIPALVDRGVEAGYAVAAGWQEPEAFADPNQPLPERPDGLPPTSAPLVGILRRGRLPTGNAEATAADEGRGRCSVQTVYADLKGFFSKVAAREDLASGSANFKKASAHWLRHTFAHEALAAGEGDGDLPTVQQLLGHASIATTGIYLKTDMRKRAQLVNAQKSWDLQGSS